MADICTMTVVNCPKKLLHYKGCFILSQMPFLLYKLEQFPTGALFLHHIEPVLVIIQVKQPNYIRVICIFHDLNFHFELIHFLQGPLFNGLNRSLIPISEMDCIVDNSVGTLA